MDKRSLRREYLEKRRALDAPTKQHCEARILAQFSALPLSFIGTLLSFSAIQSRNEFDPAPCERILRMRHSKLRVALPRIREDGINMDAIAVDASTAYTENIYGIAEPSSGDIIDPEELDLVFVPLLVTDGSGNRIGYGKGYYDRFLSRCRPDVLKIGMSYFEPVSAIDDIGQFDVPLSHCITPSRIYEF